MVCNDLPYFLAHRVHVAEALAARGWQVTVAADAPDGPSEAALPRGLSYHRLRIPRHRFSPLDDLRLALAVRRLARRLAVDVVHLITIKPVLFGGLGLAAGRLFGGDVAVIATFPGLGRALAPKARGLAALRRGMVRAGLRRALAGRRVFATFENANDLQAAVTGRLIAPERAVRIMGTGLDLAAYAGDEGDARRSGSGGNGSGEPVFLFASRLLVPKGVTTFVEAARRLAASGRKARFVVAGWPEPDNPDSVGAEELAALKSDPAIRFAGRLDEKGMRWWLRQADVVALPTRYVEGLPRVLIEGAAAGCALVSSDLGGCGEVVIHGKTGLLLPADADADQWASAFAALIDDAVLRRRMGTAAQSFVREHGFDVSDVQAQFLAVYERLERFTV
jgi:glycosyltransferase involved in cell wall biosynthesis